MYVEITTITIVLLITSLLLLLFGLFLLQQKKILGTTHLSMTLFAASFWSFCVGVESTIPDYETRVFLGKLSYVGILLVPSLWFIFSLKYSNTNNRITRILSCLVWIIPLFSALLILTNNQYHYFWTNITPISPKIEEGLDYNYNWGFLIHTIHSYSLLIIGSIILSRQIYKDTGKNRYQSILIIISMFLPWLVNVYDILSPIEFAEVEITPVSLLWTVGILVIAVIKFKLFRIEPMAKELIFNKLNNPIIIVDKYGIVVDYNEPAKNLYQNISVNLRLKHASEEDFDFLPEIVLGERKRRVYYHNKTNQWFDAQVLNLNDPKLNFQGKIIYLHDISEFKK